MKTITNQEELIRELETVLEQLREGHTEASAALAADLLQGLSLPAFKKPKRSVKKRVKRFVFRSVLTILALGLIGGGVYAYFGKENKPTISSFVTGVQGMAELATAQAYVMTTIEGSDNKLFGMDISADIPGTKRHYMIIVPAKITSGVDLKAVQDSDIKLDDSAKTVEISLPHAKILDDSIQMNDVKVYTDQGLLRAGYSAEEGVNLISQASVKERLNQQAKDAGLIKTAEDNATQALQKLYDRFGYHVIVTYHD
ncbi:DUF4230 domain-containing protein [Tumebacillus flagellatus]|uniref:DUF4230 domain-containing protein n=1 Tax=Tumebacillus flagellatus TaxID=1157490 RepID=A0A074LLT5_9BACL|nr:DUF4230 domain-containing protein [Tumebacillus flagellatus]KEO81515.1 hypothetical protein EL26_20150 [Tumebacillus flagellatus]